MDKKIKIYKNETTIIAGRKTKTQVLYYSCWIEPLTIKDEVFFSSENIGVTDLFEFKVRYCKKLVKLQEDTRDYCIEIGTKKYNIISIAIFDKENKYFKLRCKSIQ